MFYGRGVCVWRRRLCVVLFWPSIGLHEVEELQLGLIGDPAPGRQPMPNEQFEGGHFFRGKLHAQFRAALSLADRVEFHESRLAALEAGGAP